EIGGPGGACPRSPARTALVAWEDSGRANDARRTLVVRILPGGASRPSHIAMSSLAQPLEPPRFPLALKRVAALLALSIFINYVDRGSLSIAAPLLKDDLQLSASQLGILLSSFFWTYAFCQILSGWAVDRFNVNWLLPIGVAVWSAATLSTGLVRN